MSLIGLDIGTTGCKALIFGAAGEVLGSASREYPIHTPRPDWAEQDAEQVWSLALECLAEASSAPRAAADPPSALALSVQGEAVTPVDGKGRALRRTILGMDTRTTDENRALSDRFGARALYRRTGMPVHTVNTLPKLMWLKAHEPDVWKSAARFMLYEDFFLARLCGEPALSPCLASRTQMADLATGEWAHDLLDGCGIDPLKLSRIVSGPVGTLGREAAAAAGLKGRVTVSAGGHDQACAALGSGVAAPGLAMVSTGTAEVVEVAMAGPVFHESLFEGNISIYRHAAPGLYVAMTLNQSGGLLLRWLRDTLGRHEAVRAASEGRDAYDLLLEGAPEGPTDLFVLPHFAGSGTPWFDTDSRGAVLGLNFTTRLPDLAKAFLEGLTFDLRVNLDLLRSAGVAISELHAVGGGAKSAAWLRLKADVCGVSLRVPRVTEAACLGAAVLAGAAAGEFASVHEGLERMLSFREPAVRPDPARAEAFDAKYRRYLSIYPMLREFQGAGRSPSGAA
jgi:xylulokinase